jgi:hypothetical protein
VAPERVPSVVNWAPAFELRLMLESLPFLESIVGLAAPCAKKILEFDRGWIRVLKLWIMTEK